ncbi:MAG TPA: methyl-accepting chemotaxis protein, partial [Candidatus Paceibacterota bacterium]|nr:methyl-accepting chemotaxis protein [Candidatus Paceibacterota bacterium]
MRHLKIKTRLWTFLGFLAALLIVVSLFGFKGMLDAQRDLLAMYENNVEQLGLLKKVSDLYAINLVETSFKTTAGILDWSDARNKVETTHKEIDLTWKEYMQGQLNQVESTTLGELRVHLDRATSMITNLITVLEHEDKARLETFGSSQLFPAIDPIVDRVNKLASEQLTEARDRVDRTRNRFLLMQSAPAMIVLIGLTLTGLAGYFLILAINDPLQETIQAMERLRKGDFTRRLEIKRQDEFGLLAEGLNRMSEDLAHLVGQVQRSGLQVGSSVTQASAIAKQQQTTASEIAATTAEIGATSNEISATSKELLRTMGEVSATAEQTAQEAGAGQAGLNRMEANMCQIMEAAGSISGKLAVLNEKAGHITQVVTTITKVADQTNLLSLNAAIEAEKAGEYGRGFAVVATEIRRLSDQTAVATYDIEQIVKEIQSAVSAGVMGMDKFSEEVRRGVEEVRLVSAHQARIIQQVQALKPGFESVNDGMQS